MGAGTVWEGEGWDTLRWWREEGKESHSCCVVFREGHHTILIRKHIS